MISKILSVSSESKQVSSPKKAADLQIQSSERSSGSFMKLPIEGVVVFPSPSSSFCEGSWQH